MTQTRPKQAVRRTLEYDCCMAVAERVPSPSSQQTAFHDADWPAGVDRAPRLRLTSRLPSTRLAAQQQRSRGSRAALNQELPGFHDLSVIEPDVEVPADAIDVRLRNPGLAGVLGVGMPERDVNPGDLFVLENVAD